MGKPFDFENKSRLLTDDEKELVKVLARFYEHIEDHGKRIKALEDEVEALRHSASAALIVANRAH